MTNHAIPPVTGSAAVHAERIRAREERAEERTPPTGQSTAERIAARILPGYRRDEELREQARLGELRARGIISAEDDEPDVDEVEEYEEEPEAEGDAEEAPLTTAERYAAVEMERREAEHAANLRAQAGAGRPVAQPVGHRYAAQLAQPHRYANRYGPNPAA
ncbi:hypothetical protein ACIPIC_18360 [Streptomyces collinus]|uniref:hypothetical protein n=1 Tax=Streptomyces collinus TaxID=42684 RepID=UPI00380CAC79